MVQLAARAYYDLDTCRPIGMAVGKIPWPAIWSWVDRQRDLDDGAREILVDAIRYVDDLEFAERAKKSAPSPTQPRPPRGPAARVAQGAGR